MEDQPLVRQSRLKSLRQGVVAVCILVLVCIIHIVLLYEHGELSAGSESADEYLNNVANKQVENIISLGERDSGTNWIADHLIGSGEVDNVTPDFGVIGFPKTGTTFLLDALRRHPEVFMPGVGEVCDMDNWFPMMSNASRPSQSRLAPIRIGFKCPTMLRATHGIESLMKIAKQTRLVMGVRHPVTYFESFYNYRVYEWYNATKEGFNPEPVPSPLELTGKDKDWHDVSVKYARFDIYMKQLAKVSLSNVEMREMLDHDNMFPKRMSPNPYKIFIYTMEQIRDHNETRRLMFQKDLQEFLQLRSPFDDFASLPKSNEGKSDFKESIDICEDKYSTIRSQLTRQGAQAKKWIINEFIRSPDVFLSDAGFFKSAVSEWDKDPCERKKAYNLKRASNSTVRSGSSRK